MAANRIYIQVDFQSDNANAAINELNKNIGSIGPATESATKVASAGVSSLSVSIAQASQEFLNFGNIIAGLAVVKLAAGFATVADELNRIEIGLTALNRSAETTAHLMNSARQIAKTSPFTVAELAGAMQQMEAFKFKAAEIPATLKNISNAMAALNKDAGTMETLIRVLGTGMGRDKIPALSLYRQVASLGVDVNAALKKMLKEQGYGVFTDQDIATLLKGNHEIGLLSGRAMVKGILESLKEIPDVSEQMGKLVTVNWKNVVDDFNRLVQKIEGDFAPALESILKTSEKILDVFMGLPDWVTKTIEVVGTLALALGGILTTVTAIREYSLISGGLKALGGAAATGAAEGVAGAGASAAIRGITTGGGLIAGGSAVGEGGGLGAAAGTLGTVAAYAALATIVTMVVQAVWKLITVKDVMQAVDETWFAQLADKVFGESASSQARRLARTQAAPLTPAEIATAGNALHDQLVAERKAEPKDPAIEANEAKLRAMVEAAEKDLASAREKEVGFVAGIEIKYAKIFEDNAKSAKAIALFRQAEALRISKAVEDYQEKTAEEHIKNERARLDALASYADKIARRRSEIEAAQSTATLEQAAKVTAAVTAIEDAGAMARAKYEIQLANEVFQQAFAKRQKDLAAAGDNADAISAVVAGIREDEAKRRAARDAANEKAEEEVARRQADLFKTTARETTEYEKSLKDESRQEEISAITRNAELAKGAIKTGEDQNAAMRVATIEKVAAIDLAAQQALAAKKAQFIEEDLEMQKRADAIRLASLAQYPEIYALLRERLSQDELAAAADVAKKKEIIAADSAAAQAKIIEDANRQANEKIIEEQKQVYDKLKSAVGTVFDALFQKGKSVWQELADAAKKALMGMLKEIVTSNVAASMMKLFTGEPVTMESRGSFGSGPLGKLAGVFTQHPVFHAPTQLEKNLADLKLQTGSPSTGTPALPVKIVPDPGGPPTSRQEIDQTIRKTTTVEIKAPPGLPPSVVAAAVAAASPGVGIGGGGDGSGGYTTSSTISYAGGGTEDLGGGTGSFGGGLTTPPFVEGSIPGIGVPGLPGGFGGGHIPGLSDIPGVGIGLATKAASAGGLSWGTMGGPLLLGSAIGLKGAYSLGQSTNPIARAAAIPVGAAAGVAGAIGLAALFPDLLGTAILGGPAGLIIAGAIGAAVGLYGLLHKTDAQKAHDAVQKAYGIDIKNTGVLNAIAQAAKKYGDFNTGVMSPEVQQIVHMYELSQGMNATGNLPRPMYSATLAQNSAAGGLQLQPVYSSGQLVASPYSGATTQNWSQGVYVQLNPQQANDLLSGKIIDAMNNNPGTVASANATGLSSGQSLTAQRNALIEPLTVMS